MRQTSEENKRLNSYRKKGRAYLVALVRKDGHYLHSAPSNKFLYGWVHANKYRLPDEHRKQILACSARLLPVVVGKVLINGTVETEKAPKRIKVKAPTANNNHFYASWEWKTARFAALKRWGADCMCCGSRHRITVDHILPIRTHPELRLDQDNLQILCNECNMGKGSHDTTDFRPITKEQYLELDAMPEWLSPITSFVESIN